jgi:hypothetical protein
MEAIEMMKVTVAVMFLGMGLVVLGAGCSKDDDKGGGASGDSIGIAECDAYFKAVDSCKDAAVKTGLESGAKAMHDSWKAAAANAAAKDTLKTSCKTATDAIVASCAK